MYVPIIMTTEEMASCDFSPQGAMALPIVSLSLCVICAIDFPGKYSEQEKVAETAGNLSILYYCCGQSKARSSIIGLGKIP